MISALFVRSDSIYKSLDVDCWDIDRDASAWPGGNSIIAHPPCRAWGQLAHMANPRPGEKELAIMAVNNIRKWGGVLEHPFATRLKKVMNFPNQGWYDEYGGFVLKVNQHSWGHKCEKKTLLYICGCEINDVPEIPINNAPVEYIIATSGRRKDGSRLKDKKEVTKKEREETPVEFAKWLIKVAEICNERLNKKL